MTRLGRLDYAELFGSTMLTPTPLQVQSVLDNGGKEPPCDTISAVERFEEL